MKMPLVPFLLAVPVLALVSGTASAQEDGGWKVFGTAQWIAPLDEEDVSIGTVEESVRAADEFGYGVGFELRFNRTFGLELDYVNATHDVELDGTPFGEVDFEPVSASLNVHLIRTRLVDLWVAPTYSYVVWGDVELEDGDFGGFVDQLETDSETAWGATVGLDVGLGEHLALTAAVRYLDLDLEPELVGSLSVNPLFTRAGIALRF